MSQDYYKVLGVAREADQDTIKKAYRKLAMQFHPDKNPGNKEAEDKFKEAATAYEILGNPEKRAQYDRFGHAAFQGGGFGGGAQNFTDINDIFNSFGDIFGDIFGGRSGGRQSNRPSRGADLRYVLDLGLEQVMDGLDKDIEFESDDSCQPCRGTGAEPGHNPEVCTTCRGTGQVVRSQGFFQMATTCHSCGGQGQIIKAKCKKCRGQGRVSVQKKIRVKVPPGVKTGTRLRVAGEGEGGMRGGPAGDLYVEIRVREDNRFARRGDDLVGKVNISYLQAILGATISTPGLKGTESVEIPAGTQPGQSICLQGKGLPSLKGYGQGDMYFEVSVSLPQKVSKEEETLLRELANLKGDKVKESLFGIFKKK